MPTPPPVASTPPRRPDLLPGLLLLSLLCVVFYAVLWYFAGGTRPMYGRTLLLSLGFCLFFSLFLGSYGRRITRRVWPAVLVHSLVAAVLLFIDVPVRSLARDADVAALVLAAVALPTLLGSLLEGFRMRRG